MSKHLAALTGLTIILAIHSSYMPTSSLGAEPATRPAIGSAKRPTVWMHPPAFQDGLCFRELFEHPDQWEKTRGMIDVLEYADHRMDKQFSDAELMSWFAMMKQWNLKLALETGAVKPWGTTGAKTFGIEKKKWDRYRQLGGELYALAMDEPLCACRKEIHQSDEYGVEETAKFIALVREYDPKILVGEIEAYPFITLADHIKWIEALQKKLAEMNVRGIDFYRLDVNWVEFTVFDRGNWQEVRKLELYCRQHKVPFSLIYWASGEPGMRKRGIADDSTWYVSLMQQGYDYVFVDGHPDQMVIESWIESPHHSTPESDQWTFTRSVQDFTQRFVLTPRIPLVPRPSTQPATNSKKP